MLFLSVSTTARWVRFMISLELSNVPVSAAAVCTTFAVKASRGGGPSCGHPVTSMYWKPL